MIDAAVLRAMLAAGATAETIVAAVIADQETTQARLDQASQVEAERIATKKEKSRQRSRAYRERRKLGVTPTTRDVRVTQRDERDCVTNANEINDRVTQVERDAGVTPVASAASPHPLSPPQGSPLSNPLPNPSLFPLPQNLSDASAKQTSRPQRRKASHAIPVDWQPKPTHFDKAAELCIDRERVLSIAEDMRLWAGAKDERKVDWDLTFHRFLRTEAERRPQRRVSVVSISDHQRTRQERVPNDGIQATRRAYNGKPDLSQLAYDIAAAIEDRDVAARGGGPANGVGGHESGRGFVGPIPERQPA